MRKVFLRGFYSQLHKVAANNFVFLFSICISLYALGEHNLIFGEYLKFWFKIISSFGGLLRSQQKSLNKMYGKFTN